MAKSIRGRTVSPIAILVTVLLVCLPSFGQGGATGAIAGAVLGTDGAPIANAEVEIRIAGGGSAVRTVFADGSGACATCYGRQFLKVKELAEAAGLGATYWDFGLFFVIHAELVGAFEPGDNFADVILVDEVGAMGAPE